jgi:hypothetical protein
MERNCKVGQNPPRVVAPVEEEEEGGDIPNRITVRLRIYRPGGMQPSQI